MAKSAPLPESTLSVRLQPRASRDEVVGLRDGKLVVRVTAPPAEGRANLALCRLLARRLRVARTRVTVIRGETAREKVVRIDGLSREAVARLLGTPA